MEKSTSSIFAGKTKQILLSGILILGILLDLAILGSEVAFGGETVWKSASLWISDMDYTSSICMAFVLLIAVSVSTAVAGIASLITGKGKRTPLYPFGIGFAVHMVVLVFSGAFEVLDFVGAFWTVLQILLTISGLVYALACYVLDNKNKKDKNKGADRSTAGRRGILLALGAASVVLTLTLFYIPFCSYTVGEDIYSIIPMSVLTSDINIMMNLGVFSVIFVLCTVSFSVFLSSFKHYQGPEAIYAEKIRNTIALNALITGGYFMIGVIWASIRNSKGADYTAESYLPFLLTVAIAIFYAFTVRGIDFGVLGHYERTAKGARLEFFVCGLASGIIAVGAALSDILQVTFTKPASTEALRLNGFKILTTYNSLDAGFQLAAFFIIAILAIAIALFVASLVAYISKSKLFYRITLVQIIAGTMSALVMGLFGKYYEVVQKINQDALLNYIGKVVNVGSVEIVYRVKSQAFYWFLASMVVVIIVLIRKPYTRGTMSEAVLSVGGIQPDPGAKDNAAPSVDPLSLGGETPAKADVEPCPAFAELDAKADALRRATEDASDFSFESPTLPGLVQFVVNYARDSRLHLSYTPQDIAAFIAGLGATRLTILQGMSGTGKTSLPKIFTEAVLGTCDLVEVESSWRDKNELLGYYNEFSRTYTPKKFTQALYKARLDPERLTFIVLDEMNLSRIEYYFSDFLSLMEHEEDKRELKLLNTGLFRTVGGKKYPYLALTDGHTVKIPANVWFVGTANRDESTFEISDKVYDRAHTMNFNKRAPKVVYRHEPIPQRYLSADTLLRLFAEAEQTVHFDLDASSVVREAEELLAPYNITFGNRVAKQMEIFVRIYTACFAPSDAVMQEGLETILLSKVVSKLELRSVENKEQLASEFARLRLDRCSEFIRKLHED